MRWLKNIFDNTFLKVSISPEFNPIEELFRKIKILLRNKHEHSNLENDITSVYNNVSLNDIKSFFNNSYREIEKYQNME